jgi:Chaperone of endosialidase
MSGTDRDNVARLLRTITPDNPPEANKLRVGELSLEMSDPMRIWMGVPIGIDPSGRRLLYDRTWIPPGGPFVPISGGLMTGPLTLYGDPTQPLHAVPLRYLQANYAPIAGGGYVQKIGDTMSGALNITSPTDANLYVTGTGSGWPGVKWNTTQAGSATGYFESQRLGKSRWSVVFGTPEAETGGNAGTNFRINRFADDGTVLVPMAFAINRASGTVDIGTRLMLAVDPTAQLEAVTMRWVQNNYPTPAQGDARWVNVDGDAMTGALSLSGNPTAALHAVPMQWIQANYSTNAQGDARWINVSGDAMTGLLSLSGDPSQPLHAVPLQFLQANYSTNSQGDTRWVNVSGDTMTLGQTLTLGRDPAAAMEAVTQQWVQANYSSNTQGDLRWVNVTGDAMTGPLTITAANPQITLNAAAGVFRSLSFSTANLWRWHFTVTGGAETGANAGSDFTITRMDDAGGVINAPFSISRATGRANFVNGISTNNNVATLGRDLSQHIDLYGGAYGFSITGSTLNIVTGIIISFRSGDNEFARMDAGGLAMLGVTDITLARDPTLPMHATNKRWADAQLALYLPLTGGTLSGNLTVNGGIYANAGLAVQGGDLSVGWGGAGGAWARLNTGPGYAKGIAYQSNSLNRWGITVDGTGELVDGSNAGATLIVQRFNDAGGLMGTVLTFSRVSGLGTVYADPVDPMGIATKKYADDTIVRFGGPFLPLSAGAGVPLSGMLYLPFLLPTLNQHATNKLYVDQRDALLQQEIAALAQNLIFIGQIDVTTDTATYTVASGLTSPGPLPAPIEDYKGFYVIVVVPGDAKQPSNIPPGTYVRSDWLVCDGTAWIWLKLGLAYFTASEVAVLPTLEGTDNVQDTLQWLVDNKVDLDGDTLTGPLYLHAMPTTDTMAADKRYVDGLIARSGGPWLPIAGGTLTGPLITTKLTDQSGDIISGTVTNSTGAALSLVAAPSVSRAIKWWSGGHLIWGLSTNNPEFGGVADTGGDLGLYRYSDVGGFLGTAFTVSRKAGNVDFAAGISFGDMIGANNSDLTKHVRLHSAGYGISVTPARLNVVTGGDTFFVNNNADVAAMGGGGLAMIGATDITLARAPTAAMHAVNKGYLETAGDARWVNTNGDTMSGGLEINAYAPSWGSFNFAAQLLIRGVQNNGIGIFDSSNANPIAIINGAGTLGFYAMPPWGDSTTPPVPRLTLEASLATFSTPVQINYTPNDTSAQLWLRPQPGGDLSKSIIRFGGTFAAATGDGGPRYVASIRAGFVSNAWSYENLDIWLNNGGSNDANSDANQTRAARFMLGQTTIDTPLTVSSQATFVSGANFNNGVVQDPRDLSKHLNLFGGSYGFSVTGSNLNLVSPNYVQIVTDGGQQAGFFGGGALWMGPAFDIVLSRDPTADMHAVNRRYLLSQTGLYLPLTGGSVTGTTFFSPMLWVNAGPVSSAIIPNQSGGSYNPLVQTGDVAFLVYQGAPDTGVLTLAPWSNSSLGIRIDGAAHTVTVTATTGVDIGGGPLNVYSVADFKNLLKTTANVGGVVPPPGNAGYIMWNGSGSQGEMTFANGYTGTNTSFSFRQVKAAGVWDTHATLDNTGLTLSGIGVRYNGVAGGGNVIGFAWTGSAMNSFVDGTNVGTLAVKGDIPTWATTPPPMNGAGFVGSNQWVYAQSDHVHPTQQRHAVIRADASATLLVSDIAYSAVYLYGSPTAPITLTLPVATTPTQNWQMMNITSQPITLAGTSGGTITLQPGASQQVWTDGGGVYPMNSTTVQPALADRSDRVATTAFTSQFLQKSGGQMTGLISFGQSTVGAANDMTRHISLYDGFGGLSVTGGRINVVGGAIYMVNTDNTDIAHFDMAGLNIHTNMDVVLSRDPSNPMHATTRQYVDAKFVQIAGGDYVHKSGDVMTGPLGMGVAVTASAKARTIQTEMLVLPWSNGGIGANVFVDNVGGGTWRAVASGAGWMMINGATDTWQLATWNTSTAGAAVTGIGRLTFDGRGNLALGILPPQAHALGNGVNGGWLFGWGVTMNNWAQNAYYDGTNWRFMTNGHASQAQQSGGGFQWQSAGATAGTKDDVCSMITRMMIDPAGNLTAYGNTTTTALWVNGYLLQADSLLNFNSSAGKTRYIMAMSSSSLRWQLILANNEAETGGDAGSNFQIARFNDAGNYLGTPLTISRANGNVTMAQTLYVNSGRMISAGASNPAVTVYNTAGYAGGMWQGSDGNLYFGDCDGGGTPTVGRMYIDRSSQFWGTAAVTSGYLHSTGSADVGGALGVGGRATVNEIMNVTGVMRVANNDAYYMQRDGVGNWNFVEGGTNICYFNYAGLHCRHGQSGIYEGGSGVVMEFSPNWYWDWNLNNGTIAWMAAGNTVFTMDGGLNAAFHNGTVTVNGSRLVCNTNCTGIQFVSGAWASSSTFVFGWSNMTANLVTVSIDSGGAAYAIANASDARLKHNVAESDFDCLDAVSRLSLVSFDWLQVDDPWQLKQARARLRSSALSPRKVRAGLIAQEVAKVIPEAVHAGDDFEDHLGRVWNLDSNVMDAVLVGAIKQLVEQNTALAARITQLEQQRMH